jgi:hypothetical protein
LLVDKDSRGPTDHRKDRGAPSPIGKVVTHRGDTSCTAT